MKMGLLDLSRERVERSIRGVHGWMMIGDLENGRLGLEVGRLSETGVQRNGHSIGQRKPKWRSEFGKRGNRLSISTRLPQPLHRSNQLLKLKHLPEQSFRLGRYRRHRNTRNMIEKARGQHTGEQTMANDQSREDGRIRGGFRIVGVRTHEMLERIGRARSDNVGCHKHGATGTVPPTTEMATQTAEPHQHTDHGTTTPLRIHAPTTLLRHQRNGLPVDGIQPKSSQYQRCKVCAHSINRIRRRSAMRCLVKSMGCRGRLWQGLSGVDSGMSSGDGIISL